MAASAILAIKILADAKQATSALEQSGSSTSKWSSGLSKAAGVATVALGAVAAVAISGVKAAADDAQQQAILAKALTNSAGATKAQVAATEDWITKTAFATGVADDQLRPALGNLVRATGDVSKSQKAMALALDISAATGKDVTSVSAALAKGYSGNTTALGRLVPGIDKATLASKDMDAITAELAHKVGGSAAAAANTAAGQYQIFKVAIDETKEGIGAALLPVLTSLAKSMSGIAQVAAGNTTALTILLGVVAALAAIVVTVNAVTKTWVAVQTAAKAAATAWKIAQFALNVALAANPIGVVIVLVAALVAGIILAYKNSATFRAIVTAAFDAVRAAAAACWGWIKANWPLLLAVLTGPFGIAVAVIVRHWGDIKQGGQSVLSWARSAWDAMYGILVEPFRDAWSTISGILSSIRNAVASITKAIRSIPVPKIPDLNPFSASRISSAYAVPAGGPTAFASGARVAYRGVARAPAAARGTSGSGGVNITINGAVDPAATARQIRSILARDDFRAGRRAALQLTSWGAVST